MPKKSPSPLQWWRLTLDAKGHVTSCVPVEALGENTITTLFVPARTEKEAGRKAFNLYCKLRLRARRAKLKAEGKCRCGRPMDVADYSKCSFCRKGDLEARRRSEARSRGEVVQSPLKHETLAKRREDEKSGLELSILLEVEHAAGVAKTLAEFRRWLVKRVQRVSERKVA